MKDIESGDEITFPSIYKASRFIGESPRIITFWEGRVWKNKYEIKVCDSNRNAVTEEDPDKLCE